LNLEIDKVNVDYPIPFKNKNSEEIIPIDGLSTGTKALLLYMLPMYQIDTEKSIILIDEPERSLYPDMQMELMDFYRGVAPNAQFIIATHSPFIAASFEPEERFILYFDDNGNVKVKRGISPIGDDPNDILKNDFNIDYINDFGKAAFEKYLALKNKINSEKDLEKKEDLISKYEELGDKYNF
jgi:predicted ATP-binding protein involved in virulence